MTNDDQGAPATAQDIKRQLDQAYEAGRSAGKTEDQPQLKEYSNGQYGRPSSDPTFAAYESDLRAAVAEARAEGVLNMQTDARIIAVKVKHGR